ncbi:MAG: flagellar biosynthetic protein FliO [Myxococcales bacterium]|nr:MAG: flagellar biosynthetic protein FliO [Myxococcales bacterium]
MESFLLIKILIGISTFLAAIYLIVILIKRRFLSSHGSPPNSIKIISYRRIDQKTALSLVEIEGRKFLLASNGTALALEQIKNTRIKLSDSDV